MIRQGSILSVADNFGVRTARCICVYKRRKGLGQPGDLILVSVKRYVPHKKVIKGELYKSLITAMRYKYYRKSGIYIQGTGNYIVILDKRYRQKGHTSWKDPREPFAKRLLGTIDCEIRYTGYFKVLSMAPRTY